MSDPFGVIATLSGEDGWVSSGSSFVHADVNRTASATTIGERKAAFMSFKATMDTAKYADSFRRSSKIGEIWIIDGNTGDSFHFDQPAGSADRGVDQHHRQVGKLLAKDAVD